MHESSILRTLGFLSSPLGLVVMKGNPKCRIFKRKKINKKIKLFSLLLQLRFVCPAPLLLSFLDQHRNHLPRHFLARSICAAARSCDRRRAATTKMPSPTAVAPRPFARQGRRLLCSAAVVGVWCCRHRGIVFSSFEFVRHLVL